mmetsp:Transcript_3191/g.8992  ORF Transcript_3191/g.8992 Transcript_3191/m.8992 type:complete len:205 (+) Transcript_3191:280-894(+)
MVSLDAVAPSWLENISGIKGLTIATLVDDNASSTLTCEDLSTLAFEPLGDFLSISLSLFRFLRDDRLDFFMDSNRLSSKPSLLSLSSSNLSILVSFFGESVFVAVSSRRGVDVVSSEAVMCLRWALRCGIVLAQKEKAATGPNLTDTSTIHTRLNTNDDAGCCQCTVNLDRSECDDCRMLVLVLRALQADIGRVLFLADCQPKL